MISQSYPPLSDMRVDDIANELEDGTDIGYPAKRHRLFLSTPGLKVRPTGLVIPNGPWNVTGHANRLGVSQSLLDPDISEDHILHIARDRSQLWQARGLLSDQFGRPVHPYWHPLLKDERIGLPTGLGVFYRYGPNFTVDCVAYRYANELEFLFIQQKISKKWAFPGGFMEPTDDSYEAAARREAGEETGLTMLGGKATLLTRRLPMGRRDTLHAWIENTAVLLCVDPQYAFSATPVAGDDALDACWLTPAQVALRPMPNTHREYLAMALETI